MTGHPPITSLVADVNARLNAHLEVTVPKLLSMSVGGAPAEREVWMVVLEIGRLLLAALLTALCARPATVQSR